MQIICGQPLPFGGVPTTGAGLRAWSLGEGLKAQGCDVVYSLPMDVVAHIPEPPAEITDAAFDYHELDRAIEKQAPSVIVLQGWTWANLLTESEDIPVAVDLTGPYLIESLYSQVEDQQMMPFLKLQALGKADYTTCAGEVQRHYFLPWLHMSGHDVKNDVCPAIPMSLDPDTPEPLESPEEPVFVYGGIFLPWQDPTLVLKRVIQKIDERQSGRLLVFAGPHPTFPFPTGTTPEIIETLRSHPRVEFAGVVPFEDLTRRSKSGSIFIDLMARNVERELAFTTRTVVALWCGLPVLYNDYSELSAYIADYDAGWTTDPGNTDDIDRILNTVFDKPDDMQQKSRNAQRMIREKLNWTTTVAPLAEFCHNPFKRPAGNRLLNQTISPLDDRFCRMLIKMKKSSLYSGLKRIKKRV
ncbi:MAG: glycosyltransferase [Candidatus Latescibacteria bacterium]|nr:glycosyltransferase [Candidatus Latescibacterota bacterium]